MTENQPERYKVVRQGNMKYIAMPPDAEGEFWRYKCHDGAYTFLPCPPAPALPEMKEQPISCQSGTPGGEVPSAPKPKTAAELLKLKLGGTEK